MTEARSIRCPSCGVRIVDERGLISCPSCGAAYGGNKEPFAAEGLQEPAFPRDTKRQDDTAPLSEFVAAGAVLGGAVFILLGLMAGSGLLALGGVILMFGVVAGYSIFSGSLARTWRHGMSQFGFGVPHSRGHDDQPEREEKQDRRGGGDR